MQKSTDTAAYIVTRCENCGMLNILPREEMEGYSCADCGGGPLSPLGYGILRENPLSRITVEVSVERTALDKLIEDVAAVHDEVEEVAKRMQEIRGGSRI